jgi:transcriptional regulator with XRE-family HTH domain
MNEFASRLLEARSSAGLTQKELADQVGISSVQLSRYEGGKSQPRPPVLAQLAKALGVSPSWLASGELTVSPAPAPFVDGELVRKPDGSGEMVVRMDSATREALEAKAKSLGVTPEAALKIIVLEGMQTRMEKAPAKFSKSDIEAIAAEVEKLLTEKLVSLPDESKKI